MADDGQNIRGIHWRQVFPFTHVFRSFRVAVHPSKLLLGLGLLLTVYTGGRLLDSMWQPRSRALPGEVAGYENAGGGTAFEEGRDRRRKDVEEEYAHELLAQKIITPYKVGDATAESKANAEATEAAKSGDKLSELQAKYIADRDKAVADIRKSYDDAVKARNAEYDVLKDKTDAARKSKDDDLHTAELKLRDTIIEIYNDAANKCRTAAQIKGDGLFFAFFDYEVRQVTGVVESVRSNQWTKGPESTGVIGYVYNFLAVGPIWLIQHHTLYFVMFAILFLAAWSLFGGAISRIAAVHVARDEKISIRQAFSFSVGKFASFVCAPVIPLALALIIGLVISAGALIGNVPQIGPILIGALFFLALLAGFVMTLVLVGLVGGFNLMYPTVAVEGSDSFDAISRSFSYVYARPWRMAFYTLVAIAYGALTYLFIKYFLTLMLVLTHHFVDAGMFGAYDLTTYRHALSTMWPDPSVTGRLTFDSDYTALNGGQKIGAALLSIWVYLTISMLGAFAISFYFSANTIIYFLMRHEVDATEMDDVYLEQSAEDFGESPPVTPEPTLASPTPSPSSASPTVVVETTTEKPSN